MRALGRRPTTLERWPKGVHPGIVLSTREKGGGDAFFQKRIPRGRSGLRRDGADRVPVGTPRGRDLPDGDRGRRLGGPDGDDHLPSVARPQRRRRPPRRAAARPRPAAGNGLRRRRARRRPRRTLSSTSSATWGFPKTSGGRGVHIYVRIEPRWTFTDVRHAAIAFGRELERRLPGEVTTKWWKEERGERIFVDYNQNARDRTIASAYSVRPKPGAPGLGPGHLGRARGRSRPRTSRSRRCRRASPTWATATPAIDDAPTRSSRCSRCTSATRARGRGTCPIRPTIRRCRASRSASSRRGTRDRKGQDESRQEQRQERRLGATATAAASSRRAW